MHIEYGKIARNYIKKKLLASTSRKDTVKESALEMCACVCCDTNLPA